MSLFAPSLAGYTLAPPSAYDEEDVIRGGVGTMADGSVYFEVVTTTTTKREFALGWEMATDTQLAIIRMAWTAIATSYSSNNFISLTGGTYTVTRHPDQKLFKVSAVKTAQGVRWKVSLRLREV
ncbi:MAG: hypothetical protein U0350_36395 [Caldilineaceae bacterium]